MWKRKTKTLLTVQVTFCFLETQPCIRHKTNTKHMKMELHQAFNIPLREQGWRCKVQLWDSCSSHSLQPLRGNLSDLCSAIWLICSQETLRELSGIAVTFVCRLSCVCEQNFKYITENYFAFMSQLQFPYKQEHFEMAYMVQGPACCLPLWLLL